MDSDSEIDTAYDMLFSAFLAHEIRMPKNMTTAQLLLYTILETDMAIEERIITVIDMRQLAKNKACVCVIHDLFYSKRIMEWVSIKVNTIVLSSPKSFLYHFAVFSIQLALADCHTSSDSILQE